MIILQLFFIIIALYSIAKSACSSVHKQTQPWLVFTAVRLKYSSCQKNKVSEKNFIFGFIKEIRECRYSCLLHYHAAYRDHIHLWLPPEPASAYRSEFVNRAVQTIDFSMTDCWTMVLKTVWSDWTTIKNEKDTGMHFFCIQIKTRKNMSLFI